MSFKKVLLSLLIVALVVGGLSLPSFAQQQRTKNFALIIDQSGEMQETYKNDSKHRLARTAASVVDQTDDIAETLQLKLFQ